MRTTRYGSRVRRVGLPALALFALLGGDALPRLAPARADDAASAGIPLPLDKTQILRVEDKPYVVDGAKVIPPNVELTVQRGVRIHGVNGASLDVQGGFKVHGTNTVWVVLRNIDFSPTSVPKRGLHFDMADVYGCKFKHAETQSLNGEVTIENSCFQADCEFDVRITGGLLRIMTVEFGMPCRIRCEKEKVNRTPLEIGVHTSWMRDLVIIGGAALTVRSTELKNGLEVRNATELLLDGCDVSGRVSILQGPDDSFGKVTLTKNNLFDGGTLVLARPQGAKTKVEKVKVDKFFFGPKNGAGVTKDKEVAALIQDREDDPAQTVVAWWSPPNERQHALVPYTLRSRAPDLR
jgi:hypothetical protein